MRIFDVHTGMRVVSEPGPKGTMVFALRYSPDGKFLVESAVGHYVKIWDRQHRHLLGEIPAVAASLAISRDGKYLAMGATGKIIIWKFK